MILSKILVFYFSPPQDPERLKVAGCFLPAAKFSTHIDIFFKLQKYIISVCRIDLAGS